MTKGRGSQVRRLGRRQRMARIANHIGTGHPFAIWWEAHRSRAWYHRNAANFTKTDHPKATPRRKRKETRKQRIDRDNRRTAKRVAANAARKREWL